MMYVKWFIRVVSVLFLSFWICGCTGLRIEASGTPTPECPAETVWKSYYGFDWCDDYKIKKAVNGIGLYQVTIHNNYLYSLISVISFGFVVPVQFEYQLQQPLPSISLQGNSDDEMKPTMRLNL